MLKEKEREGEGERERGREREGVENIDHFTTTKSRGPKIKEKKSRGKGMGPCLLIFFFLL